MEFITHLDVKRRTEIAWRFGEEKTKPSISLTLLQVDWLYGCVLVCELSRSGTCNSPEIEREKACLLLFLLPAWNSDWSSRNLDKRVTFGYWTMTFPSLANERATRSKEPGSPTPWIARSNLDRAFWIFFSEKIIYLVKLLLFGDFLQPRAECNSN